MLSYYLVVFTLIFFSCREKKNLCLFFIFTISSSISTLLGDAISSPSLFYQCMFVAEIITIGVLLLTFSVHMSKSAVGVYTVSAIWNMFCFFATDPVTITWISYHYENINTILFELLVCILLANTPWAINFSNRLKEENK